MKIRSKLMKMNLHQLEEICNKMRCNHGTKRKMIQNLLKIIRLKYKMESKSFSKFKKGYIDNLKKDQKYLQNLLKNKEKNLKKLKSEKKSKWFVDKANKDIEILQTKLMEIKNQIENITDDEIQQMYTNQHKTLMEKEKKGQKKMMKKLKKEKIRLILKILKKLEQKSRRDFNNNSNKHIDTTNESKSHLQEN